MIGIEIVKDKESRAPFGSMRDKIVDLAFDVDYSFLAAERPVSTLLRR